MDDEGLWKLVERIFHDALEVEAERRDEFIRTECGEDEELRRRVESLLGHDGSPMADTLATPGQRIGPYQLLTKLGEGGMSKVYLARDSRLARQVALKILPYPAGTNPERRARFNQEARAASALNHPNIVTIYDIGEWTNGLFLAMEHVDGDTLAARIAGKPLPISNALNYAIQVADALAAAHSAGIVHRDVKPANLIVTRKGQVKVLDFGIAKLVEPLPGESRTTVTQRAWTREGDLIGTVPYMSPEQAEGRQVDARSDLFSVGIVLYEMLTGRHPFRQQTTLKTLSSILTDDPMPPSQLNSAVPPGLDRVVMRCLEKDTARRFQDAADLKVALEWIERDRLSADSGFRTAPVRPHRRMPWLAAAVVLALAALGIGAIYWLRIPPEEILNPSQITNDVGITSNPALSRDGTLLAYASDRMGDNLDIYVQHLGGVVRRTTNPADDGSPDFSPDGSTIVFERTGGGVLRMGTFTGGEAMLAPGGMNPRFSPDGSLIAYWVGDRGEPSRSGTVFVVRPDGSDATRVGADFTYARFPLWAPDGDHLLVQGARRGDKEEEWWVVPVHGGPAFNTGALAELRRNGLSPHQGPSGWSGGEVVFCALRQRMAHIWSFTLKTPGWRIAAPPQQVTFGAASDSEPYVTADREVVFFSYHARNNLWRVPLRADGRAEAGIQRLSATSAYDTRPTISADGRTLAFLSRRSETWQVWVRDMETGEETEVTTGPQDKTSPAISADGSMVAYSVLESGQPSIYIVPAAGSRIGAVRRICEKCGEPSDWTSDGKYVLYAGAQGRIYLLDVAAGTSSAILTDPEYSIRQPHLSPDGRWVAFVTETAHGQSRLFIAPFRVGETVRPDQWIAASGGQGRDDKPRWLGNDALIYFSDRDGFGCLWKQRLDPLTRRAAGEAVELYPFHALRYSLRTLYRGNFEIAVARNAVVLNLADLSGNIWRQALPKSR